MDFRIAVLLPFLVPALVSGICAALAARQPAKDAPTAAFRAGLGLTLGFWVGWAMANTLLPQNLPWLPREATHWLFWLPLGAALAALCFAYMTEGGGRVILMIILVTAFSIPMVKPLWQSAWKPIEAIWITGSVLALGVLGWAMLARIGREMHPAPAVFWFTTLLGLLALPLATSGAASLAQTTGIFAAVLGPLLLIAWWRPGAGIFGVAPSFTALALLGLLVNGRFYSDLGVVAALLIIASPVVTWALVRFGPGEGVGAGWVKGAIGLLPAAAATAMAIRSLAQAGSY